MRGVTLGAALAFVVSFIAPMFAQLMLITIPLWMMMAVGRAKKAAFGKRSP